MSELQGKRIFIFQQRGWAINIGHFLAKNLQAEKCRLAALTFKRTTHEFILNQKEVKYDLIINNDEIMSRPKDYLQGEEYSFAEICEALGVDSIWPFIMTLRNHVRSYKDKFYYGFKQNVPDEEIKDYVMAVYKYIKFIFDKFNPQIIIAPNYVALPHIMFNLYAMRKGVKMIGIADTKVRGYRVFSESYINDRGPLLDRIDALNNGTAKTGNREKAKEYIREFRENFIQPDSLDRLKTNGKKTIIQKIKGVLSPYKLILYWYIIGPSKNHIESIGISPDYKPPRIILRDHYCQKRYKKFMDHFNYFPFEKIGKYVYFPLQFQPESTIDVMAPYASNQIETARQAAMSLPDDYVLVVKEHPGMAGFRPPSYLEKIDRTPNIKLIDYRISNEQVLKKADLIISPNSTSIAEAVFYKKPAIQLGNLGLTLKLPNIYKHTDMTTLSAKIKQVLKTDITTEEYERRLENFVAAVFDVGFNFKYSLVWSKGKGDNMDNLWKIYKNEIIRILNYKNSQ